MHMQRPTVQKRKSRNTHDKTSTRPEVELEQTPHSTTTITKTAIIYSPNRATKGCNALLMPQYRRTGLDVGRVERSCTRAAWVRPRTQADTCHGKSTRTSFQPTGHTTRNTMVVPHIYLGTAKPCQYVTVLKTCRSSCCDILLEYSRAPSLELNLLQFLLTSQVRVHVSLSAFVNLSGGAPRSHSSPVTWGKHFPSRTSRLFYWFVRLPPVVAVFLITVKSARR